jgi:hypothetical protein
MKCQRSLVGTLARAPGDRSFPFQAQSTTLSDNIKAMSPNFDAAIRELDHIGHWQLSRPVAREQLRAERGA